MYQLALLLITGKIFFQINTPQLTVQQKARLIIEATDQKMKFSVSSRKRNRKDIAHLTIWSSSTVLKDKPYMQELASNYAAIIKYFVYQADTALCKTVKVTILDSTSERKFNYTYKTPNAFPSFYQHKDRTCRPCKMFMTYWVLNGYAGTDEPNTTTITCDVKPTNYEKRELHKAYARFIAAFIAPYIPNIKAIEIKFFKPNNYPSNKNSEYDSYKYSLNEINNELLNYQN